MKIVIADTTALISLMIVNKLHLIVKAIGEYYVPNAVWDEILNYSKVNKEIFGIEDISKRVINIKSMNYLKSIMDLGESEAVILYNELEADYLLTDDSKARQIAESIGVNCIGSIGILIKSKELGLISNLKEVFVVWVESGRFFSKTLLNEILKMYNEELL